MIFFKLNKAAKQLIYGNMRGQNCPNYKNFHFSLQSIILLSILLVFGFQVHSGIGGRAQQVYRL